MRISKFTPAFVLLATTSLTQIAHAQTQTIATPLNVDAINLLNPFSTLSGSTVIQQNLTNAFSINNSSTAAQRQQALVDNTITTDNGVVLTDGLGSKLNTIWRGVNSQAPNGTTITFSPNVQTLLRQINAISQDDSGKAKNFFADGSANGTVFISNANLALGKTATSNTPITNVSLAPGGVFNIYDKSYAPVTNPNRTGNSRPVQVSPGNITAFSGTDFFGNATSNTAIIGGVNGNTGSGLFANASFPSGHTTFGYTTSLLMAMLVPEAYTRQLTRASEYGNSRIILGAHYPLDIVAGRALASYDVSQMLNNNPKYLNATVNGVFGIGDLTTTGNFQAVFKAAQADTRNLLTAGCGTDIATCVATSAPDRLSNLAQDQADYTARLTYGLQTLSFAQAPREAAPASGDASILLATVYGGDTASAKNLAPSGGMLGSLTTNTINQIIINTETNAIAGFFGTALSYWARIDLVSAVNYFQNVTGTITLASSDVVKTNVTVGNTGVLAGTGTVGATTVASGGTLQPGSPGAPGTLKVAGNLAFQSGALYLVQAGSQGTSSVSVTGTAALAGNVQVASANGGFKFNRASTILTSAGTGGTAFASLLTPTGVTGSLGYAGGAVAVNLSSSLGQIAGLNANQRAVGAALDGAFNVPGGSTGALGAIFTGNVAQNLTQASGELATASQQTTFNAMGQFMGLMTDPTIVGRGEAVAPTGGAAQFAEESDEALAYAANGKPRSKNERDAFAAIYRKAPPMLDTVQRWSVWAAGFGGSQTTDGNAAVGSNDTTSRIFGGAVGADYRFSPFTIAGFSLAGGGTNFSVNGLGSGHSDLFQAGAFVRHTVGAAYLTGALAYGWQDITTNRTVTIAGSDMLRAEFNANAYSGRIEGGYRFVAPWMTVGVTPYAAGQFTTFDLPAYAEQVVAGAGTFAQTYAAKNVTDTRSELGLRTDKSFAMTDALLVLRGRAAWAHDFNPDRTINAPFQTLPGASFTVNGAAQAADAALVTASAEVKWLSGFSVAGVFEGEFSDVTRSYAGKGIVRYQW